jgi:uncharacterized membrane protein
MAFGIVLLIGGIVLCLIGGLMMLINAFKVSVAWGLGCLFLAPVGLIFLVKNWEENKKPFFLQLAGIAMVVVSVMLAAPAATQ